MSYTIGKTKCNFHTNRKINMIAFKYYFKRYFHFSSLGANAALKDFSNVTTKNLSQNGYYKFPDGLMIQRGKGSSSVAGNMTVYLPVSFLDTTYCLVTTMETLSGEQSVYTAVPYSKATSYFSVRRRYATGTDCGDTARSFDWFAVGRWK